MLVEGGRRDVERLGDGLAGGVPGPLDVTPPTFHQHLRTAERKLLATLLDPDSAPESG